MGRKGDKLLQELRRYSKANTYEVQRVAEPRCRKCRGRAFELESDEEVGVVLRRCVGCGGEHLLGDGYQFAEEAELESHECNCLATQFALRVGVALYEGSRDVRWLYVAAECLKCGLGGVYVEYKCESWDDVTFLRRC